MFRDVDDFYRWKKTETLRERLAVWGLILSGSAVLTASATLVGFRTDLEKIVRGSAAIVGGVLCAVAGTKSYRLVDQADDRAMQSKARIDLLAWKHATLVQLAKSSNPEQVLEPVSEEVELYDWNDAPDDAVGFVIAGNSGAGKSSTATYLAGLLTQQFPAQVFVLDPHHNTVWKQNGLISIGKIPEIEAALHVLIDELDKRCERQGLGIPLGEPVIVIADEVGACKKRFSDPKFLTDALERLGSEGRKFDLTLIAINQSSNALDLGISAQLRNNYLCIALNASARALAYKWHKDDPRKKWIKNQAYSCVVFGSVPETLAPHPTHGGYTKYRKKGNAPQGLLPVRQLPLTLINQGKVSDQIINVPVWATNTNTPTLSAGVVFEPPTRHTNTPPTRVFCPNCSSRDVVSWGKTNAGAKRYKCKGCGKTFA